MQGWGAGEPPSTDMPYTAEEIVDGGAVVKSRALYILFLLMGIAPIFLFALVIFWEKHWNKQRQADVEQDINASKVVEPLREGHLMDLMKNYTMILSKSDICDENCHLDRDEEDQLVDGSADKILSSTSYDTEMQISRKELDKKEAEALDSIECDDSLQYQHSSFCIPLAGQRLAEGGCEDLPRRIESDGCAVCMNTLDVGQKVVWSSNPECPHVFHQQCLLDWFAAVGAKKWKAQAARHIEMDSASLQKEVCKFPKLCPICRRDYFLEESSKETVADNETEDDSGNEPNEANGNNQETPISINSFDNEQSDIEQGSRS